MTDLTGFDTNRVFRTDAQPVPPYYYISAHLDISGMMKGQTFYFNKDNNLSYLDPKGTDDGGYYKYWMIDSNAVIGDVVVYSNSAIISDTLGSGNYFEIGGADSNDGRPVGPVVVNWAGKTGHSAHPISVNDINTGSVCYYGHEGGHNALNDNPDQNNKKVLAISLRTSAWTREPMVDANSPVAPVAPAVATENRQLDLSKLPSKHSRSALRKLRQSKQVLDVDVESGTVYVIVKVYPKFQ